MYSPRRGGDTGYVDISSVHTRRKSPPIASLRLSKFGVLLVPALINLDKDVESSIE